MNSTGYRILTATIFVTACVLGRYADDGFDKWVGFIVATVAGACFQLSFTLRR